MPSIQEIRQQYPQYSDMSDTALADALHSKFYSDIPRDQFDKKIGLSSDGDGMLSTIGSEIGGQFMTGVRKASAAFNPLSEENRAITKKAEGGGFFDLTEKKERGELLGSGLGGVAQAAGSWLTGPVRALGAPAIQSLDVPMRAATKAAFGPNAKLPPELTHEQAADTAESLLGGIAPRGGLRPPPRAPGGAAPPGAPALDDIFASSNAHYEKLRSMDVPLRGDVVEGLATSIRTDLEADAFYKEDQPRTFRSIERLMGNEEGSSSKQVYAVRTALGRVVSDSPGTSEAAAASRSIEKLDDYLSNIPGFAETARAARQDWAAAKTSEMVQEMQKKATRAAEASGSGANLDNATRQQIKSLLNDKKRAGRLSPEETELAEEIVRGGKIGNLARLLSKLGPKHPLTGWGTAIAADLSGTLGTATGSLGVGAIAQWLAERLTTGKILRLDEMIRGRSALAGQTAGDALSGASAADAVLDQPGYPQ